MYVCLPLCKQCLSSLSTESSVSSVYTVTSTHVSIFYVEGSNLFFSRIFYKFLILILNWTAQITGLNWRKLIELLRNLKIKRRMSKKIQLFTVEDSLKSSPLCVRQWSSVFPSPPSSNPREVKKIQEDKLFFGSWGW